MDESRITALMKATKPDLNKAAKALRDANVLTEAIAEGVWILGGGSVKDDLKQMADAWRRRFDEKKMLVLNVVGTIENVLENDGRGTSSTGLMPTPQPTVVTAAVAAAAVAPSGQQRGGTSATRPSTRPEATRPSTRQVPEEDADGIDLDHLRAIAERAGAADFQAGFLRDVARRVGERQLAVETCAAALADTLGYGIGMYTGLTNAFMGQLRLAPAPLTDRWYRDHNGYPVANRLGDEGNDDDDETGHTVA